jgi:alpha-mannosidase
MIMTVAAAAEALNRKHDELRTPIALAWKYPGSPPADPVNAIPDDSWNSHSSSPLVLVKNEPNWLYAEFEFPETQAGIPLTGASADIHIYGWCPFTLWFDGVELFKEQHAWFATGPIADPVPVPVRPGEKHRLAVRLTPTELPAGFAPLNIAIRLRPCVETAVELAAAAAQLRFGEAIAATPRDRSAVAVAARAVDLKALAANDWSAVLASVKKMELALQPLSSRAKAHTIHLLGHSHIDMDWTWTWSDTVSCMRRDFKATTDLMDDIPDLTFAISQIPSYDVVRRMDPEVFRKVRARIAEGRWENAAGTWVEGDLHMADGESLARQIQYAAAWTAEHLGTQAKVLWEPDCFGHPASMPQVARLGEFDAYYHMRGSPGSEKHCPLRLWEGSSGHRIPGISGFYNGDIYPNTLITNAIRHHRAGLRHSLHMWGQGDHGGAMARYQLRLLALYREKPLIPTIRFGTVAGFLKAVRASRPRLPVAKGETYSLFEGCWTTHVALKARNRQCEGALLAAEALCALAGLDRRTELRDAWTPVLFNQFHDLLDGSAVHDSYLDTERRATASLATANRLTRDAAHTLAPPKDNGRLLVILNPLGFERTEPVRVRLPRNVTHLRDDKGRAIPVQHLDKDAVFVAENVGAFGWKGYRIMTGRPPATGEPARVTEGRDYGEQGDYFRIETAHSVSRLSRLSGAVGAYYDKQLGKEFIGYGVPKYLSHVPSARMDLAMNVFQVVDESPNGMSAWLINDVVREESLLRGAEVSRLENGPVFTRFRVVHRFRSSRIEEEILFYTGFPRVDFRITVHWNEKGSPETGVPQLKVSFAGSLAQPLARFEGPFCVTERPADGLEQPTQKWLDLTGADFGFTLLNDSRYGCDALGGRARMTLLRNPYAPDPETDNGAHVVNLALCPHGPEFDSGEIVRRGMAFNRPLIAARSDRPPRFAASGLRIRGSDSVVCTCLKTAETSEGVVVRFFETSGRKSRISFTLGRGIRAAQEVNFLEHPIAPAARVRNGRVTATFGPYEIKSFRVQLRLN